MATTYNVWFGETGSMVLVSEGQATTDWTIDTGSLEFEQEYTWRIDSIDEYGTRYGDLWTFTVMTFVPPSNRPSIQRLVVVANDKFFYESI